MFFADERINYQLCRISMKSSLAKLRIKTGNRGKQSASLCPKERKST